MLTAAVCQTRHLSDGGHRGEIMRTWSTEGRRGSSDALRTGPAAADKRSVAPRERELRIVVGPAHRLWIGPDGARALYELV